MSCLREAGYTYNQGVTTYIFSFTNGFWYKAANNNTTQGVVGESNAVFQVGIVSSGAEIANAANLGWGPGYVGGGDIKTEMAYHTNANQAISYLSIADAKGILAGAATTGRKSISFGGFGRRRLVPAFMARPSPTTIRPSSGELIPSGIMKC